MYGEKGHRLMTLDYNFYLNYVYDVQFSNYLRDALFKNDFYQMSSFESK
jgi:hypothetical protein